MFSAGGRELIMENGLDCLVGTTINGLAFIHDYFQIFTDRGGMNINNPLSIFDKRDNKTKDITSMDIASIQALIQGENIVSVDFSEGKYVKFILNNDVQINVSLLDEDYTCPEAIDIRNDEAIIIW